MLSPLLIEYDSNIKTLREQIKTYKVIYKSLSNTQGRNMNFGCKSISCNLDPT